jgi:hypothetical protein
MRERGGGPSLRERSVDRRDERHWVVGDPDEVLVSVGLHDVTDGGRDDWPARGEVLERLGGADELRPVVPGERHHRDVPSRDVRRELSVQLEAEPVDVRAAGERGGVDLHDRTDEDEVEVRPQAGDAVHELEIETLVDHAEEPDARPRDRGLVQRVRKRHPCLLEMREVDAARKGVDAGMSSALRLVQAPASGEDEIGRREQLVLSLSRSSAGAPLKWESSSMQSYTQPAALSPRAIGTAIGV